MNLQVVQISLRSELGSSYQISFTTASSNSEDAVILIAIFFCRFLSIPKTDLEIKVKSGSISGCQLPQRVAIFLEPNIGKKIA